QNDQNKSQTNNNTQTEPHRTPPKHHHSPEMLASTVQFSKNNRAHQPATPQEETDSVPQSRGPRHTTCPFPQDPTACPTHHPPDTAVPTPQNPKAPEAVLAGSHEQ